MIVPLEASIGLTPASAAKEASLRSRLRVGGGDEYLCGAERADAVLGEQLRAELASELGELAVAVGEFGVEQADAFRESLQRRERWPATGGKAADERGGREPARAARAAAGRA